MLENAPYGTWRSPITADLIVSTSVGLGQPTLFGQDVYWIESRPLEGGRNVIVRRRPNGTTTDLNPPPFNARTRVHEYGGGDYLVNGETVYFANFADQKLYRVRPRESPEALTHDDGMRYAAMTMDALRSRIVCVREDHTGNGEAVNAVVAIDLASGDQQVLVQGADFYSDPRVSPDGAMLAWLSWQHPNMPWDGCELHTAPFADDGSLGEPELIAGGPNESIFQPEWSPLGVLHFVSDRSGWWNLYRCASPDVSAGDADAGLPRNTSHEDAITSPRPVGERVRERGSSRSSAQIEPLVPMQAEFGQPQWVFGMTTYDFDGPDRIVCCHCERGAWKLATIDASVKPPSLREGETDFTLVRDIRSHNGRAVFFGGSPSRPSGLFLLDLGSGQIETLKLASSVTIEAGYISQPRAIEFPTEDGLAAHGFFYPPQNVDFAAPTGELPPLLVMSHGGPTAATAATLRLGIQYWTSRGIAVLDVNYGGSTGYGRAYRERLNGRWGIVDVDDCVNGARNLVERGLVDGDRLAITGGSAGGFTTLAALTFRDTFKAGASHYGIGDLEALARDTHKFESRYLDGLVGPYPERRDIYLERSPIHHVEHLSCPVIFFQGLEDQVVPPNQAQSMVEALRQKGVPVAYLAFEGEQHGFRRAENIKRSLEAELYFYGRIFNFTPTDTIEPVPVIQSNS
jgi:dipeptidyl aminopeptidase/acylaminoacyl peptidase